MDRSAQMDELDSLKSIYYSEEFQVADDTNQNFQAIFWAFNKLPDDYVIKYFKVPGSHDSSYMKIKHLPPIELRLTFPEDYPSQSPPKFVISCQWLPRSKISLLCKKLDELWLEYGPVEIVYIWCDFLKNDTLTFLGCENELDLRELCSKQLYFIQKLENNRGSAVDKVEKEDITIKNSKVLTEITESNSPHDSINENGVDNKIAAGTSNNLKMQDTRELKESNNKYKEELYHQKQKQICKKSHYKNKFDERAFLDLNTKTSLFRSLENYNAQREKINFLKNFFSCKICCSDKLGKDCVKFKDCGHVFCTDCVRSYFTIRINSGTVQSMKCPEDKCLTEALPSQIKEIVSEELFAKYDTVLLNNALDSLNDIIYCPRQLCQYPVTLEPNEKMASCPNCQYVFCVTCKMVYHGIEPCQYKSAEVKKLVELYEKASRDVKSQMETKYGKKHLEGLVNNCKTEAWIQGNSKACPKCEVAIEKAYGCNKMVCWKCNAYFCWLCSTLLDVKDPYLHFRDPHSKCANKLFYLVYDFEDEDDEWDLVDDNGDEFLDTDFDVDVYEENEGVYDDDDDDDVDDDYDVDDYDNENNISSMKVEPL